VVRERLPEDLLRQEDARQLTAQHPAASRQADQALKQPEDILEVDELFCDLDV